MLAGPTPIHVKPKVLSGNRALALACAIGFSGLNIDGLAIDFIFCVDVWFPCVFLGAVAAHGSKDSARFANQNMAMDKCRNFGRFVCQLVENTSWITYQHEVDSGWLLVPTSSGSVPFRNSSSLGHLGFWRSLGRRIPRCLTMRWSLAIIFSRFIQRL